MLSRGLFVVKILISLNLWKGCGLRERVIRVDMLCCCDDSTCELLCGLVVVIQSIRVTFHRRCYAGHTGGRSESTRLNSSHL